MARRTRLGVLGRRVAPGPSPAARRLMARPTRLGVLGWPVAHSRSPAMQNAALQAVGLADWRYQLLPVPPDLFDETVKALPRAGFRGANVTIPYKEAALALATDPTPRARAIGAANTITFGDAGQIHADNTDAPALVEALPFAAAGNTALVLGAGGSARAVVWALVDAGAGEVRVWNRRPERARRLCAELGCAAVDRAAPADLLVNCSPIGLQARRRRSRRCPSPPIGWTGIAAWSISRMPTARRRWCRPRGRAESPSLTGWRCSSARAC